MSANPLVMLQHFGQSFWYDNISRSILRSGELKRMIDEDGLSGVTSNPTIFHQSIKSSNDYDDQLKAIFEKDNKLPEKDIFYSLAIKDITDACDLLWSVYERTKGEDGYVSIEIDPHLAYNTEKTIVEAVELFQRISKLNLLIKIPATKESISAIEELIFRGVNVNVTLLFSIKRYEEVIDSYLRGIERRVFEEKSINDIMSVASFFVSRVDTLTDRYLEEKIKNTEEKKEKDSINALMGKIAVANAKMAYEVFNNAFSSTRFYSLKDKGARVQRLLWGSTSTKNPAYRDVLYVEELIGHGTINTIPTATVKAFKDHGKVARTIDCNLEGAKFILQAIEDIGISIERVTQELEDEGVRLFEESFDAVLKLIAEEKQFFF